MQQGDFERRKIILAILAVVAFVVIVVMIAVVTVFVNNQHPTTIINQESAEAAGATLESQDFATIGEDLHTLGEEQNGLTADAPITAAIREASYTESVNEEGYKRVGFLLDVDTLETTYYVTATVDPNGDLYNIYFACTFPSVSKYPNTFCIGTDNINSIDTTLSDQLPYEGYQNGVRTYTLDHYGGANFLSLKVYTHCDDQAAHDSAVEAATAWVKAAVPEIEIPIQEEAFENTCSFGIDGEI